MAAIMAFNGARKNKKGERMEDNFRTLKDTVIYQKPDNPIFKIFYIAVEKVETFSFADGPKTYSLLCREAETAYSEDRICRFFDKTDCFLDKI
jgi:hypothetical protein